MLIIKTDLIKIHSTIFILLTVVFGGSGNSTWNRGLNYSRIHTAFADSFLFARTLRAGVY